MYYLVRNYTNRSIRDKSNSIWIFNDEHYLKSIRGVEPYAKLLILSDERHFVIAEAETLEELEFKLMVLMLDLGS